MGIYSNNMRISAILPANLVNEVRKASRLENIPQSSVIKRAIECWLNDRLKRDAKKLAQIKFDDLPSEDDWLLIQPEI